MKSIKQKVIKIFAVLLCAIFMMPSYAISAIDIVSKSKEVLLQNSLEQYFNSRCVLDAKLLSGSLDGVVEQGMLNDELKRVMIATSKSIWSIDNNYTLISCSFYDNDGEAVVVEDITYRSSDLTYSDTITHNITFGYTSDFSNFLILSDGYFESYLAFKSCSYVSSVPVENSINSRTSATDYNVNLTEDYAYDIVQVAVAELGYIEKNEADDNLDDKTADAGSGNYTKYGRWYGWNGDFWCSIFVAWCANQAGVSTNVIPKNRYGRVREKKAFFVNEDDESNDLYFESFSQNGTYVPKIGDLFFTYNAATGQNHIGIVRSVLESEFVTIEGNKNNQVLSRTISFTDNTLVGFASPAYATAESAHDYECSDHSVSLTHICNNCGKEATAILSCSHESGSHIEFCSICEYEGTASYRYIYNTNNHWKCCTVCENEEWGTSAHRFMAMDGGTYHICRICKYDTRQLVDRSLLLYTPILLNGED